MKKRMIDIAPGELFLLHNMINGAEQLSICVKLEEKKAANLDTFRVINCSRWVEEEFQIVEATLIVQDD